LATLTALALVPKAVALPTFNVPAVMVTPVVKVPAPFSKRTELAAFSVTPVTLAPIAPTVTVLVPLPLFVMLPVLLEPAVRGDITGAIGSEREVARAGGLIGDGQKSAPARGKRGAAGVDVQRRDGQGAAIAVFRDARDVGANRRDGHRAGSRAGVGDRAGVVTLTVERVIVPLPLLWLASVRLNAPVTPPLKVRLPASELNVEFAARTIGMLALLTPLTFSNAPVAPEAPVPKSSKWWRSAGNGALNLRRRPLATVMALFLPKAVAFW